MEELPGRLPVIPESDPTGAPGVVAIRGADRRTVLTEAVRLRRAGAVPLIGDERWSSPDWARLVQGLDRFARNRPEVLARAGWAGFTSGSSGTPRVVLRTSESWEIFFPVLDQWLRPRPDDVLLLPAHPVASLTVNGLAWAEAAGVEWAVPVGRRLRAEDLAGRTPGGRPAAGGTDPGTGSSSPEPGSSRAAAVPGTPCPQHRAPTLVHGTPAHLTEILDLLDGGVPHRLRTVLVGGDRLPAGTRERAAEHGVRVVSYYGAAELSFVAADHGAGLRAVPGVQCLLREGQLYAHTYQAALGVLAMSGAGDDEPVWTPLEGIGPGKDLFGVGDLADIDDGRILLRGRADDAILTAGATVVPADVEAVLSDHPNVAACLVHAEKHPRIGALVAAAIELRPEPEPPTTGTPTTETVNRETVPAGARTPDARTPGARTPGARSEEPRPAETQLAELRAWCRRRLAPAQVPRRWRLVARLPRTASGKVRRLDLEGIRALTGTGPENDAEDRTEAGGAPSW